jgi:RNA polymerase sigma factor for flagellar operon FliA
MKEVQARQPVADGPSDARSSTQRRYLDVLWPVVLGQRNDLVLEHLPLVKAIAARCRVRLPSHLEFSDLVQAGILGLLDAARKYNTGTDASFSTYATHRIRGAILDNLRTQDPAARKLRRRHRELESARRDLMQELQRSPTEGEVSERSGIDLESLRATARDIHQVSQMSAGESASASAEFEQSKTSTAQPESIYQVRERARLVKDLIAKLPECYRMVITMHYMTDLSLKEISGSFGVPERQVSRMHTQALTRIHAMLQTKGITARAEL